MIAKHETIAAPLSLFYWSTMTYNVTFLLLGDSKFFLSQTHQKLLANKTVWHPESKFNEQRMIWAFFQAIRRSIVRRKDIHIKLFKLLIVRVSFFSVVIFLRLFAFEF